MDTSFVDEDGKSLGKVPPCKTGDAACISRIWTAHNQSGKGAIDTILEKVSKSAGKRKAREEAKGRVAKKARELAEEQLKAEMLERGQSQPPQDPQEPQPEQKKGWLG